MCIFISIGCLTFSLLFFIFYCYGVFTFFFFLLLSVGDDSGRASKRSRGAPIPVEAPNRGNTSGSGRKKPRVVRRHRGLENGNDNDDAEGSDDSSSSFRPPASRKGAVPSASSPFAAASQTANKSENEGRAEGVTRGGAKGNAKRGLRERVNEEETVSAPSKARVAAVAKAAEKAAAATATTGRSTRATRASRR